MLVSDGFTSYVIFLYADGLIQWSTGDASGGNGGLGGNEAHVGFNADDGASFTSHEYSQTHDIINISNSSRPAGLVPPGVLIYRGDRTPTSGCSNSRHGKACTVHIILTHMDCIIIH